MIDLTKKDIEMLISALDMEYMALSRFVTSRPDDSRIDEVKRKLTHCDMLKDKLQKEYINL